MAWHSGCNTSSLLYSCCAVPTSCRLHIMLAHTSTSKSSVWQFVSALAAAAALLPLQAAAAGAAAATTVAVGGLSASDDQQLRGAVDLSGDIDIASAGQLRTLHSADELDDAVTAPGRDLLMKGKKGRKGKKGQKGKRARNGKKGKRGRKGKRSDLYPRTPEGEAKCSVFAVVEEVEVYDADFLHASASAPRPSCTCLYTMVDSTN